ncbi:hypothetical protein Y032_0005g2661 [Ancylostoma ceylanicum]|uniref:Uncharacterized protein n=1 Tax=Ancylostoma ceylanicum TaxID=53326 RepID=A0A016VST1_9BILA|nr:hypothetical protein Y032_0005g2661 [Ancylostoma ceylanicum]
MAGSEKSDDLPCMEMEDADGVFAEAVDQVLITNINTILHATSVFSLKLVFSLNFLPYTYLQKWGYGTK